jgi:tetratricopeptide (TPR) repeat protein
VKTGKVADRKPVASCFLPQVVRVAVASQQHYGVSLTRDLKKPEAPPPAPLDKIAPELRAELQAVDSQLAANPADPAALLARAAIFEKANLPANALADYRKASSEWKEAVWVKGKIFEIEEMLANATATTALSTGGGKTYAILFGVSKYKNLPQDLWLQFANRDAEFFGQHLSSPRGGGLPPENVTVLTEEHATTAAVRNAFDTLLKGKAGKQDTIIILIAGHGTVETPGSKKAFILTYDSDPQDLTSTALPMEDLQNLVQEQLGKVGRVVLFVDVCRAGIIGTIKSSAVNSVVEKLAEAEGEIFGLMASRPKELSYEGPQWGGGHGAFSYFLMKGLAGAADKNKDGLVNVNETIEYVRDQVAAATSDKQHPRDFGNIDNNVQLADTSKPGINVAFGQPAVFISGPNRVWLASAASLPIGVFQAAGALQPAAEAAFQAALNAGKILPDDRDGAFNALEQLERQLAPAAYLDRKNKLRVALEDRTQEVLLNYLAGEQVPQTQAEFAGGAAYAGAALRLTPESQLLQGREAFFRGRAGLFDKAYAPAIDQLEFAVRFDPNGAYSYNALGIAYLEQARFPDAAAAFRDAVRRAPHWAYPLHNLALTMVETGDYQEAIKRYQQAIRIAPKFGYLPYNMGLVYQRLNRNREASEAYRQAMKLSADSPEPYNAMGSLLAGQNKWTEAEAQYRKAIALKLDHVPARHNLALLMAARSRAPEAVALWREILAKNPDFIAGRLSLAENLSKQGNHAEAAAEYRRVVALRPESIAAQLSLSQELSQAGDREAAAAALQAARQRAPNDPRVHELAGDIAIAGRRTSEAVAAYDAALNSAVEGADRKRLRDKRKKAAAK